MTKTTLYALLKAGNSLADTGILVEDEDAVVLNYKPFSLLPVDDAELLNHIAYIPCVYHNNEIPAFEENLSAEDIMKIFEHCYTVQELIDLAGGNKNLAVSLYEYTEWEIPNVKQMVEIFEEDGFLELYGETKERLLELVA